MGTLVLVRHGLSQWNLENRFTGWSDIPLAPRGKEDAGKTVEALRDFRFDVAFTSRLLRANDTLNTLLKGLGQTPRIEKDSALNERHYGDLQGLNKSEMIKKYGEEQVHLWRRSFSTRPPNGESIEDCVRRVMPFVHQYVMPEVFAGKTVLVAAHGNSLRPIFRDIDKLDDDTTATLEVSLVTPYVYTFDGEAMKEKAVRTVKGIVIRVDQKTGEPVVQD